MQNNLNHTVRGIIAKSKIERLINALNISNKHWYDQIENVSSELTKNLNESNRITHLKIRYIDLRIEFQNEPDNVKFLQKLQNDGFSKEDLEDIGVNEKFIKLSEQMLLPKKVADKYNEYKLEMYKYKNNI